MTIGIHEGPGPSRDIAADRALRFLFQEAEAGFPEVCHRMKFPSWAGFTAMAEEQNGDIFARAVLADVLLDIAVYLDDPSAAKLREAARREAAYVAESKLRHRLGGWSYFPSLPELPPDLDSLAAAMTLFGRIAPEYSASCEEPIEVALEQFAPSGELSTWLVSSRDARAETATMRRGISRYWGAAVDIDVCARFYRALLRYGPVRYRPYVDAGVSLIARSQRLEGGWWSTWYFGEVYGNALCIELLADCGVHEPAAERALDRIANLQRHDGGWGENYSYSLDTAVALWELARRGVVPDAASIERGQARLLYLATAEGFWEGTPWIVMNTGRAQGSKGPVLSYRSTTLTTALCLRTLLAIGG